MTCVLGQLAFDINEICRLCLRKQNDLINVFLSENDSNPSYANMVTTLGNVPAYKHDGLPPHICSNCKDKLESSYKFRLNILRTYDILCRTVTKNENHEITPPKENSQNLVLKKENTHEIEVDDLSTLPVDEDTCSNFNRPVEVLKTYKSIVTKNKIKLLKNNRKTINKLKNKSHDKITASLQKLHKNRDKCPLCLQQIQKNEIMMDHFYSHYNSSELTPLIVNGKKTKSCNLCNKNLKYNSMVPHHRIHLKIYPFKCEIENCDKGFVSSQYLTTHQNQHAGLKKYQCQSCGKTFGLRSSLKNHEETHIFENVECKICHKTYKNNIMLKIHMKRHNNGLKFKCDHPGCDKAFYVVQELNRHRRMHTGDKTHVCDKCSKAWYTAGELERHQRYHMTVRQYRCSHCLKSFVERTQLRLHEMGHRGERPHVCEFCSTAFVARSKLKRHQMKSCKVVKDSNC